MGTCYQTECLNARVEMAKVLAIVETEKQKEQTFFGCPKFNKTSNRAN